MLKLFKKREKPADKKQELVQTVAESLDTPIVQIQHGYLCRPFYYPGSAVARYGVTCLFNPEAAEVPEFLSKIEKLATEHGVDTIGYIDDDLVSIKFQTKEKIEIYVVTPTSKKPAPVDLKHDLPKNKFMAVVNFELKTYYNKKEKKNAFTFCPKKITLFLENEDSLIEGETNGGSGKGRRGRPRTKNIGVCDTKLQSGNE